ncbi:cell division protein ZapB [Emticicia agri]|uniref:BZIP transcription factor n=1 Tax=Emticicia agri TaxID=2492393 RepID=A0A4Q5M255_9BACT|nr:cell division protein ZapB [Emticicia agri]RYU96351.1 hypothetical protein EWM59_07510 [Emticicia agri]
MKKLLLLLFVSTAVFGQSVEITPTSDGLNPNTNIRKSGIGYEHSNNSVRVGTFVNDYSAFIQTHSNHPLRFATNNGSQQFIINTDGKVGIGSFTPFYWLDVKGRGRIRHNTGETAGIWYNKSDDTEGAFAGMYNNDIYGLFGMGAVSNWKFGFDLVNTKMGIGTMTPKHPLTFSSALGDKISFWGGNTAATDNHYGMGIQSAALQLYVPSTNESIVFGTGRSGAFTEKVRITGAGNVGIGINNPQGSLEVTRGTGVNGTAAFYGNLHSSHFNYSTAEDTYIRGGKANSKVIINDVAGLGNVGIGTASPAYKLQVNTTGNIAGIVHADNTGIRVGTYIGYSAGWFGTLSNHPLALFVNNGNAALTVTTDERFQFGGTTIPAGYKMSVDGKVICTELEVLVTPWPDYVFKPDYRLKPLHEVENFIQTNGHLPNIPKASEIESKSLAVGNMSKLQMEKIEELTLYLIEMNKRLQKVEAENEALKKELNAVKSQN